MVARARWGRAPELLAGQGVTSAAPSPESVSSVVGGGTNLTSPDASEEIWTTEEPLAAIGNATLEGPAGGPADLVIPTDTLRAIA